MNQTIQAPLNARQMIQAFAMYNPDKGPPSLLGRIDFTGVTRRQVFFNTLGRAPGPAAAADGPRFNPRQATLQALQGEEFQTRLREIVLAAFPEKRRLIFVHIPKCAGTDLQVTLARRYPSLHLHLCHADITPKLALFEHLQKFAVGLALSDSISLAGHVPLRWYQERGLARFEDQVFTAVRDPREMLYSFVSFILTRAVDFIGTPRRDVSQWLSEIGLSAIEPNPSPATLAELGGKLLRVRQTNLICNYLGTGTAASAFEAMVQSDIEVTDMARYSAWRREKFGFEPGQRVNPSKPLFTAESASAADRALVDEMVADDMVVYQAVQEKLAAGGGLSVRGRVFG